MTWPFGGGGVEVGCDLARFPPGSWPDPSGRTGPGPAHGAAGLGEPDHVLAVGALAAAGYLSVGRAGVGFAGFAFEPGDEAALAAFGVGAGIFAGPAA
ncbi:MAG TPA: hypothetical protein VF940_30045 [Streptosporangiaceae bacterium]